MSPDIFVTVDKVVFIPEDDPGPGGSWETYWQQGAYTATSGQNPRTAITVTVWPANGGNGPLIIPFQWTSTAGGQRGSDWELYTTADPTGPVQPYNLDYFSIPENQSSATLYLQCNLADTVSGSVTLLIEDEGGGTDGTGGGTPISSGVTIIEPAATVVTLEGAAATERIAWQTVGPTFVNEHEDVTIIAGLDQGTTGSAAGCTFQVTPSAAEPTYDTDYTVAYTVLNAGGASSSTGVLSAASTTITMLTGDTHVLFTVDPVEDETTEGPEDVTLTLSNAVTCDLGDQITTLVTIIDTSVDGVMAVWDSFSSHSSVDEPYDETGNPISVSSPLAYVALTGYDDIYPITVDITATAGTAGAADFFLETTSVTFPPGTGVSPEDIEQYGAVYVRISGNDDFELPETFTLTLDSISTTDHSGHTVPTGGAEDWPITIENIDPTPEFEWVTTGNVPHNTHGDDALFTEYVRLTARSNLTHTCTVQPPVLTGGDPGGISPETPFVLTFPPGGGNQPYTYRINDGSGGGGGADGLPAAGSGDTWFADFEITTNLGSQDATVGSNGTLRLELTEPIVVVPGIGFETPGAIYSESATAIRSVDLRVMAGEITDDVTVVIHRINPGPGTEATLGDDWNIVTASGAVIPPSDPNGVGEAQWTYTLSAGDTEATVYYALYDNEDAESDEKFALEILSVTGTQEPVRVAHTRHVVTILQDLAAGAEQLWNMAPQRQYYPGLDGAGSVQPDIIVTKTGLRTGTVLITKANTPQSTSLDATIGLIYGHFGGSAPYNIDYSGRVGVAIAIRAAMYVWALKNVDRQSGYVDTWTGEEQGSGPGQTDVDDITWLQNPDHIPVEGMHPVSILLDPNGEQDFDEDLNGATSGVCNLNYLNPTDYHRSAQWNNSMGFPHIRDVVIYGTGTTAGYDVETDTVAFFPRLSMHHLTSIQNDGGVPITNDHDAGQNDWFARVDNFRLEKLGVRHIHNVASPAQVEVIEAAHNSNNGLFKMYDVWMHGRQTPYPEAGQECHTAWMVRMAGTSMPDYRNVMFNSCLEHCWYINACAPHGYFIDCYQHWHGNGGIPGIGSQMSRHVDRGTDTTNGGQPEGQLRNSGGLENSLWLMLRCHSRNNGFNLADNLSKRGDADIKNEGFDGTIMIRDCIQTGRFGHGNGNGGVQVIDGESDRGGLKMSMLPPDGQVAYGTGITFNGAPQFDYGDTNGSLGSATGTITYQDWPMGQRDPNAASPTGHTETTSATGLLRGMMSPTNGLPGSKFYAHEPGQLVTEGSSAGQFSHNPVSYQPWGPNWWNFRLTVLWNMSVRQDLWPTTPPPLTDPPTADNTLTGSNKLYYNVAGSREVIYRVDDTITATAKNGGIDFEGNAIGADETITGTIRFKVPVAGQGGMLRPQLATLPYRDTSSRTGNGLWRWELPTGTGANSAADFWDPDAPGWKMVHGDLDHTELDNSDATVHPLTDGEIDIYDGGDPA